MKATCERFERWLDAGRPASEADVFESHARTCTHCAALLELETMLAAPAVASAPDAFTDTVMRRVHASAPATSAAAAAAPRRAPASGVLALLLDPLTALVLTAIALLVVGRDAVVQLGFALVRVGDRVSAPAAWPTLSLPAMTMPAIPLPAIPLPAAPDLGAVSHAIAGLTANPQWAAALMLALTPLALIASWMLFRWSDRMVGAIGSLGARAIPGVRAAAR